MKRNIKKIKRELRNFARRPRMDRSDVEGNTLADKIEVMRKNLFGEVVTAFEGWDADDVINYLEGMVGGEGRKIWQHILDVISYLAGKTTERPESLAIARDCRALQKYHYDYEKDVSYWMRKSLDSVFKEKAEEDPQWLADTLTDEAKSDDWRQDLENEMIPDFCNCVDFEGASPNSDGDIIALGYLAGNNDIIEEVASETGDYELSPFDMDWRIRHSVLTNNMWGIFDEMKEKYLPQTQARKELRDRFIFTAPLTGTPEQQRKTIETTNRFQRAFENKVLNEGGYKKTVSTAKPVVVKPEPKPVTKRKTFTDKDKMDFCNAASSGNEAKVRQYLSIGMSPDTVEPHPDDRRGWSAAESATYHGHTNILRILFDADLKEDPSKLLFLLACCGGGDNEIETARILIEHGADVNYKTSSGHYTPLMRAVDRGRSPSFIKFLIDAGADVNARNDYGNSPLIFTMYSSAGGSDNRIETMEVLLKAGADTEAVSEKGYTALMEAVAKKYSHRVELLIKYGANVNARVPVMSMFGGPDEYATPLSLAHGQYTRDIRRMLRQAGATVE